MEELKYCVYTHNTIEGIPFYVGSGTENRAKLLRLSEVKSRDKGLKYLNKVKELDFNYTYEIHFQNLSKEDACVEELNLFTKLSNEGFLLYNSRKPSLPLKMSDVDFTDLYYDPESITGLRWRNNNRVAGYVLKGKGCQVKYKGVSYYTHRVVLVLHGVGVDNLVVDHLDGNPFNNQLGNLKVCLQSDNTRNRKLPVTNKSGVIGVYLHSARQQWVASAVINGEVITKSFSILKYGENLAYNLAVDSRNKMLEISGEYSKRHGKG